MKPVEIKRATLRDVCFVAAHMRAEDRREALCQFAPGTTMLELAASSHGGSGLVYCAWYRGSPVAAFGAAPASHAGTVWSAWLFGTNKLARAIPEIGRFGLDTLSARLIEEGVRRVEVRSIEGHDIAHAWLPVSAPAARPGCMTTAAAAKPSPCGHGPSKTGVRHDVHESKDPESSPAA